MSDQRTIGQLTLSEKQMLAKKILAEWGKTPKDQIASDAGVKSYVVAHLAGQMRRNGIPLPKLTQTWLEPAFLEELKQLYKAQSQA